MSLFTVDQCGILGIFNFKQSLYCIQELSYKYNGTEWASTDFNALYNT